MKTPKTKRKPPTVETAEAKCHSDQRLVSRRRKLKLYEISALVNCHAVILAVSEKDAMEHVATWERAWTEPENADLIGVSDVELTDVRPLKASDWRDEAHHRTSKAANDGTHRRAEDKL